MKVAHRAHNPGDTARFGGTASSLTMYENTGAPLCIGPDQDEAQYC